jgi:hypothetical protein
VIGINATIELGKGVLREWYNSTFASQPDPHDFREVALKEGAKLLLKYVDDLDFGNDTFYSVRTTII